MIQIIFLAVFSWSSPQPIQVPDALSSRLKSFEPSASVYLPDLDLFLVASDDTTKKNDPFLFLMNHQGQVHPEPLVINGLKAITDIESLSLDQNGNLLILSSLGLNKNGKNIYERNLLVQARIKGAQIQLVRQVELRPILLNALRTRNQSLDVESHFVINGELYLGLKEPQSQSGVATVLNVGSIDFLFQNQRLEKLQVAKSFTFEKNDLLSDMLVLGNQIFMTTTSEVGPGQLWVYNIKSESLQLLHSYGSLRPEALSFDPIKKALFVLFDQGSEPAYFTAHKFQSRFFAPH